jgi:hypothetical protein
VLIAGFGRRGHAVGDIPGVRFKVRPALITEAREGESQLGQARPPVVAATKAVGSSRALLQPQEDSSGGGSVSSRVAASAVEECGERRANGQANPSSVPPSYRTRALRAPQVVKVAGVSLLALFKSKKEKPRS